MESSRNDNVANPSGNCVIYATRHTHDNTVATALDNHYFR